MKKNFTRETITGAIVIVLSILGIILFALNFSTGYYIYGQMNSVVITICAIGAVILECAAIFCRTQKRYSVHVSVFLFYR